MLTKKEDPYQKRYYSIGEIAEMFGVSKSLIRFWESEFALLKPHKNRKGDRRFTPENIEQMRTIYALVKERGFTLEGAKKEIIRLRKYKREREKVLLRLKNIRGFLSDLAEKA